MRPLLLATLLLATAGCQKFRVETPGQFLALAAENDDDGYTYRATSADGVVLSVRDIDNDPYGNLTFWSDAIRMRLRLAKGYALLEEKAVKAASGEEGLQMRFGREEHGKQYLYAVRLFVTDHHVFVIEAGGRKERFEARADAVEEALASFRIRGLGTKTSAD